MIALREILSFIVFIAAVVLLVDLVIEPFNVTTLTLCLSFFVLAYFVWPSKKRKQRKDDNPWLDWLELIIEFPIEVFVWIARGLVRTLFKWGDGADL